MTIEERLDRIERYVMLGTTNIYNTEQAALYLGVTQERIRVLCRQQAITYYKSDGGKITIRREDLEKYCCRRRMMCKADFEDEARAIMRRNDRRRAEKTYSK